MIFAVVSTAMEWNFLEPTGNVSALANVSRASSVDNERVHHSIIFTELGWFRRSHS